MRASAGETSRQVLRTGGISFQNTGTWKHSSDPEFGPLNLMPRPGKG